MVRIPAESRFQAVLLYSLFDVFMELLLQKATTFRSTMSVENSKVEDLRVSARTFGRCALSMINSSAFVLLLLPLPLPVRLQRAAGWSTGEIYRCPFRESGYFDHPSLISVFIVWPLASGDRGPEVMLCTSQRYTNDGSIARRPEEGGWGRPARRLRVVRFGCGTRQLVLGPCRGTRIGVKGGRGKVGDEIIVKRPPVGYWRDRVAILA